MCFFKKNDLLYRIVSARNAIQRMKTAQPISGDSFILYDGGTKTLSGSFNSDTYGLFSFDNSGGVSTLVLFYPEGFFPLGQARLRVWLDGVEHSDWGSWSLDSVVGLNVYQYSNSNSSFGVYFSDLTPGMHRGLSIFSSTNGSVMGWVLGVAPAPSLKGKSVTMELSLTANQEGELWTY